MSNTISVEVNDLPAVLVTYDRIKVYTSNAADGIFTEVTNVSTRIVLNNQDTLYTYKDNLSLSTVFYKTAYFNSSTNQESGLSNVVAATTTTNQLLVNMQVVISLSKNIKNLLGVSLGEDIQYYFTTTYTPLYSSVRKLRLEVGSFLSEMPDDTLNLAIFEASLMADGIYWVKSSSSDFFKFARREWVTCKAAEMLLNNVFALLGANSKKLDNFEIKYDAKAGQNLLDKVQMCLAKWEAEVISGGLATQLPSMVVKGDLDCEAPHVGRMWEKGPYVFPTPGSNARYRSGRRYTNGWIGQNSFRRGSRF